MSEFVLLRWVLTVEGILLSVSLAAIAAHGVWLWADERWGRPRIERGRKALNALSLRSGATANDLAVVRSLPRRMQVTLFLDLTPYVSGAQLQQLAVVAEQIGLQAHGARLCRRRGWHRRLLGARLLTQIGGPVWIAQRLLRDPHPAVRAEAAEWAAATQAPGAIALLAGLLGDPDFLCAFTVRNSLARAGSASTSSLASVLHTQSGRRTVGALEVAAAIADPIFLDAALRLASDSSVAVRAQVCALLAAIGGESGTGTLIALLEDSAAEVRAAAVRGLGRLRHSAAATAVARLLRDPSFNVRHDAGLALRKIGGPGILLLRRSQTDTDELAAAMARHVLDLPDSIERYA